MAAVSMTGKAGEKMQEEAVGNPDANLQDVQAELDNLRRDIAALTQAITSLGSAKLQEAGARATEMGAEMAGASAAAYQSARDGLRSAEQDLETRIRNNPLQAVGIAAGIGFLAALLTRR